MKIRAIRVAAVGGFREPVAVEGLSGKLDILSGPNELGKTTLFAALEAVFFEQHTTTSRKGTFGERVLSAGGGSPLVEADFEAGGRLWRLRKQFVTRKSAVLTDVGAGQIVARDDEAHARALAMIAAARGKAGGSGLLWVRQGQSLSLPVVDGATREMLQHAIEQEVTDVASGGQLRRLRARIRERLDLLVTAKTGRVRKDGLLDTAQKRHLELVERLEMARQAARHRAERLASLSEREQRRKDLADPEVAAQQEKAVAAAREAQKAANEARLRRAAAEAELKVALGLEREARQQLDRFDRDIASEHKLTAEIEVASAAVARCRAQLEQLTTKAGALAFEHQSAVDAVRATRQSIETAQAAETKRQRLRSRAEFLRRHDGASQAAADIARLEAAFASSPVSDTKLAAIRREDGEISALAGQRATLAATAPRASVIYAPGVSAAIQVNGRAVADGEVFPAAPRLQLEIPGVGVITVEAGLPPEFMEIEADEAAHREVLAGLLQTVGVATVAEAELAHRNRIQLERELQEAAARLSAFAPEGLARLGAQIELLEAALPADETSDASPDTAAADIEALIATAKACEERERVLSSALVRARDERSRVVAELGRQEEAKRVCEEARERVASGLPMPDARPNARETLAAQLQQTEAQSRERLRSQESWAERALDDAGLQRLQSQLGEAEARGKQRAQELARLREEIERIEGSLEETTATGLPDSEEELAGQVETFSAAARRLEDEAAALQLLLTTLDETEARSRERLLRPVVERLRPYLSIVLPQAEGSFSDALSFEGLQRNGAMEPLARLSLGTQEQLAILVRLAYARLLADRGEAVPIILDDALVYSDDQRIARMFEAMRLAARQHQVIVLTCRERSFESLGGHHVTLQPWKHAHA